MIDARGNEFSHYSHLAYVGQVTVNHQDSPYSLLAIKIQRGSYVHERSWLDFTHVFTLSFVTSPASKSHCVHMAKTMALLL